MAKIYRVSQIKVNQSNKSESVRLTKYPYDPRLTNKGVFKRYHNDKRFSEFLPKRWRQKLTSIDVEQN